VILIAVIILASSGTPQAQEKEDPPKVEEAGNILFLMLRDRTSRDDGEIRELLEKGLKKSGCKADSKLEIRTISPSVFEELSRLTGKGNVVIPSPADDKGLEIQQLASPANTWEFRLPSRDQSLKKLTLTYKDNKKVEYTSTATEPQLKLTMTVPGRYAVLMQLEGTPVSYSAEISDLKETLKIDRPWPQGDRYLTITLRNFVGKQEELFKALRDNEANPLYIESLKNFTLAFGTLDSDFRETPPATDGNNYVARSKAIQGRGNDQKVWIYFPLTKAEAIKAQEEFNEKGITGLPKAIREDKTRVGPTDETEVDASSKPRWFEMGADPKNVTFTRQIPLKEWAKLREKYPTVWQLVVWEVAKDGEEPEAIRVVNPLSAEPGQKRFVVVIAEEIPGLSSAIADKAKKDKP